MRIVTPGGRVVDIVAPVPGHRVVEVGDQIRMTHLNSVINYGNNHSISVVIVPDTGDVHVLACGSTVLAGVVQVPLVPE